jgi:hypothetical protein
MADSTFVAITSYIRRLLATERSITINAVMADLTKVSGMDLTDRLVDWNEAMARVDKTGINNARCTVVPVGAVETLVTDAEDILGKYQRRTL